MGDVIERCFLLWKVRKHRFLASAFILGCGVVTAGGQIQQQQAARAEKPVPAARKAAQALDVAVKDGYLTLKAENASLDLILKQLSMGPPGVVIEKGDVISETVTLNLENVPLEEGLRQLLKNQDSFFFYGVEKDSPSRLRIVWVYPKGKGYGLQPIPPSMWASTKELEGQLKDPNPTLRSEAIKNLVERKGKGASKLVLDTLKQEENEAVRTQALHAATEEGIDLPAGLLANVALGDSSENMRFLALEALAGDPNAGPVAQGALNDSSPHVRKLAEQILARLNRRQQAGGKPAAPSQQMQQQQPKPQAQPR